MIPALDEQVQISAQHLMQKCCNIARRLNLYGFILNLFQENTESGQKEGWGLSAKSAICRKAEF